MLPAVNTIIYASDITAGSRPAFRMALEQAVRHEAKITFLHVIPSIDADAIEIVRDYLLSQAKAHIQHLLEQHRCKIEKRIYDYISSEIPADISLANTPEIVVLIGQTDQVIIKVAKERKADMIIMRDRGSSVSSRTFLSSTTQKVIHQTDIPVLLVPLKD